MRHYLDTLFSEPMYLPDEERGMIQQFTSASAAPKGLIRVKPNPASDQIQISTLLPMGEPLGFVVLYDVNGHELERTGVHGDPEIFNIDVSRYAPGLYRLTLIGYREVLDGLSITIAR